MENRLDAMMHFMVSRHAMYRQVYQHRVLLAADMVNKSIVQRARDLGSSIPFADDAMRCALAAQSAQDLTIDTIFHMRESWWRYHMLRWAEGNDRILKDLCERLLHRRLFKTIRCSGSMTMESLTSSATTALETLGLDPRYYLHQISTADVHSGDTRQSMLVQLEDGRVMTLAEADPMFKAMVTDDRISRRSWIALPKEAKAALGHVR
jgi:hypothetical protein